MGSLHLAPSMSAMQTRKAHFGALKSIDAGHALGGEGGGAGGGAGGGYTLGSGQRVSGTGGAGAVSIAPGGAAVKRKRRPTKAKLRVMMAEAALARLGADAPTSAVAAGAGAALPPRALRLLLRWSDAAGTQWQQRTRVASPLPAEAEECYASEPGLLQAHAVIA